MDFSFNNLKETSFASTSGQYLKPYDIYEVNLTKIEKTELKGSKDPNAVYPIVALEFTGCGDNKGVFTQNIFIPTTEDDMKRPVYQNKEGHDYERPSRFENFQFTLMQIVHAINPAGEEKIKENSSKIKTIDQFIDLVIKALSGKNNVTTKLKLVGKVSNGTTYAALPNSCGLNKAGEIFPVNFIGDNVFFTNYELTQQKAYKEAKPTDMAKVENNPDEPADDLDLTNIEL